jgi:hypothetical protein
VDTHAGAVQPPLPPVGELDGDALGDADGLGLELELLTLGDGLPEPPGPARDTSSA